MGIRIEEHLTCGNNPSGITVNHGYYALLECILKRTHPSVALLRWCGLRYDARKSRKPYTPRAYVPYDPSLKDKVLQIYLENPTLKNKDIAKMIGRSNTFVSKVLASIGTRRNRWDYKGGQNEKTV